jgi:hypothetical protein
MLPLSISSIATVTVAATGTSTGPSPGQQCQESRLQNTHTYTLLEKLESHGVCAMLLFIGGLAFLYELNLLRFLSPYRHTIALIICFLRNVHYYQLHQDMEQNDILCIKSNSNSAFENFERNESIMNSNSNINIANHSILDWIVNTLTVNLNLRQILFIKDFLGYLILTTFISWVQSLRHISFSLIEQQAKEFLFGYAKYIPMVVAKLKEERSKLENQLEHSLKGALKLLEKEGEEKVILTAPKPQPLPIVSFSQDKKQEEEEEEEEEEISIVSKPKK